MRNFDELNVIPKKENISIDTYFDKMDITEEQKEERRDAANDLWWVLLLLFAMVRASIEDGDLDYDGLLSWFNGAYGDVVNRYARQDEYMTRYMGMVPQSILDTTWNNVDYISPESYWTSDERAVGIAVNEANSILNYEDLQKAIDNGKTHKKWVAEIDRKTREDHRLINGKTIPINEYFLFSDCHMLVPHDEVNGTAEQVVNCRCSVKYLQKETDDNELITLHSVVIPDNYNIKENEKEVSTAYWISENKGGTVEILEPSGKDGVKTPDYKWNGKLWELKSPTSTKATDSALRGAIKQIFALPGGVILNFENNDIDLDEVVRIATNRAKRSAKFDMDIMIIQNDVLVYEIFHRIK